MTDDLIARAKACPDISHARIVAPEDRVPEVVMPTATRDALCARIATQQEAIDELVGMLRSARLYVEEAVDANGGIDACEIHMRHDLEAIDALLSKHGQRT